MTAARWWPAALVAVLAVTVVANVALLWKANSDPSFAVEPDYYQRAVHWDSTIAQRQRSDALHWRAAARLAPPDDGEATIFVTLTTRDGAPVDSADVRAEASHNARGADVYQVRLLASGPGLYAARIPSRAQGLWRVDLTATRGPDRFAERLTLDNGAARAP
jgi:nitrogen fixation protein FixH